MDIDGCRYVTVSNVTGDSDDDGITIKSTSPSIAENITITNCILSSHCNALKFGTESTGGFRNITIDLIYGSPGLSDENWVANIEKALLYQIPHLSCYALTVEPRTALEKMIANHQFENTDPDTQARHFSILTNRLQQAGYEQYEISNFALPGFRSRHNSSYWQGKPYLGLGPSAHSFDGKSRQWNIANNAVYLNAIAAGEIPAESETLTGIQQLNEYIMTSLRTMEGISVKKVATNWGEEKAALLLAGASKHRHRGYLTNTNDWIILTDTGKFLADGIAADLFFTE